ncbi:MAG: CRISPR-associated ring nuclease Csm6 [Rhodocyclaceae bacterium]|nr:CRISPR-associated ring nuclease Csm6 [Rhodocyclaceae bacterium]
MNLIAPAAHPRRILLAVTGLSPQIVTETLYALAHAQPAFIPTEIHLLTTLEGARLARAALLHPDGGQFHALLADYPNIGRPAFDEANIHVITDHNGQPLSDIRTPAENAAAADAITALVAELTTDDAAALHVSIAGGRKTMGFYLGYAFSLFARPQDRLSHVLVSPPFESHPEFFFPPTKARRLATRDGRHVDTAEAVVTLAEIPVVRLRHGLPRAFAEGQASFNDTVRAIQESFAPPRLEIDLAARRVACGGHEITLKPALIAWLGFWAQTALDGRPLRAGRDIDPEEFLRPYARVVGLDAEVFEAAKRRLRDGMEKEFFEQNNSKLEAALRAALGPAAAPYLLARSGRKPNTRRGLALPPRAIRIFDRP